MRIAPEPILAVIDAFLALSRKVHGVAPEYVADFNLVLDALAKISEATPDRRNVSVLQVETRTQTQLLADALAKLVTEVAALRQEASRRRDDPPRHAA